MIRKLGIALILSLGLIAPACKGTENVVGTPIGGGEGRTYESMRPFIKKSLTAPQAELQSYAIDLRSIARGRGKFKTEFSHYEEVPAHVAQGVVEKARKEREEHG